MTYRVVGSRAQHRWHVRLLEMPHPMGRETLTDIPGESDRILEIVEHGYRGDDPAQAESLTRRKFSAEKNCGTISAPGG